MQRTPNTARPTGRPEGPSIKSLSALMLSAVIFLAVGWTGVEAAGFGEPRSLYMSAVPTAGTEAAAD